MTKQELRTLFLAKRLLLNDAEFEQKSKSLTLQILAKIKELNPKQVLIFLPIESKKEYDCRFLTPKLWSKNIFTGIPIADFKNKKLSFATFNSDTELAETKFGIFEPHKPEIITNFDNTLAIVPLLAFDKNNFRVGYGGGFYDRFFAKNPSIYKLGISFFSPVEEIDDLDFFDIKLDEVVVS
jgi:5-formyltetrahydrofolate cyclo-ligase